MEEKKTYRSDQEKQTITNRLNRIEGQLRGIKRMVEQDQYCNDILIQLSAVEQSVKSLANLMLETHLYRCVSKDLENQEYATLDEIISLFKRFNK